MDLFKVIEGWKRHHVADGLVLVAPSGTSAGAIQIRERQRPLRRLKHALDEAIARLRPELRRNAKLGVAERFLTNSGEYVALGSVQAKSETESFEHVLAMVIVDDWYVAIDGNVADPELVPTMREAVRLIATNYYTGAAEMRQRQYLFTPPPGWSPVAGPRVTRFYSPNYAHSPSVIQMFHARPAKPTPAETQDRLLMIDTTTIEDKDPPLPPKTFTTRYGLFGEMVTQTGRDNGGRQIESYRSTLIDNRFVYLSKLDTVHDESSTALSEYMKVLEDVRPVPVSPNERLGAVIHWSD